MKAKNKVNIVKLNLDTVEKGYRRKHQDFDSMPSSERQRQKQRDEIRSATREINNIKCEMHEIKDMLKTLMDRN